MTAKYGIPYFSNYINSDMNPSDVRSMCPLRGDQKVLVWNEENHNFELIEIENLNLNNDYTILFNGTTKKAAIHKFDNLEFFKVRTVNGHEIILSGNHLNLVLDGSVKETKKLNTNDYLPFTTIPYIGNDISFSYNDGFLIGNSMNEIEDHVFTDSIALSRDYRKGIVDGMIAKNNVPNDKAIHSDSFNQAIAICAMLASMGIPTSMDEPETGIYDIYLFNPENGLKNDGVYKFKDGYMWFRIESIEKVSEGETGNCFEVLNDEEPYFMLPSGMVTHNCRLRLDLRELRRRNGGFFGSGESTGSVGVVTINMPRLAYQSTSEEDFFRRLDKLMDISARSLDTKRKVISNLMDNGLYPYTKRYLGDFGNHFSTIGLVGMNEAELNAKWLNTNITTPEGQKFAKRVLDYMLERLKDYQEKYPGTLFNLEATPAESTTYRFAKHDVEDFPDIITAAKDGGAPFYTNSSHIPVNYTDDIFEALELQDGLQTKYTSGTVFHAFLGERLPAWESAAALVRKIAENFKLPYFTLSPTYSVCAEHGYIAGEVNTCPKCGKATEIYSRITGYYRPVKNWNDGKAQEFVQRKTYEQSSSLASNFVGKHPANEVVNENNASLAGNKEVNQNQNTYSENTSQVETPAAEKLVLVSTKTCPKCKMAKEKFSKSGVDFSVVYAEDDPNIVKQYKLTTAPVLLRFNENSEDPIIVRNFEEIMKVAG